MHLQPLTDRERQQLAAALQESFAAGRGVLFDAPKPVSPTAATGSAVRKRSLSGVFWAAGGALLGGWVGELLAERLGDIFGAVLGGILFWTLERWHRHRTHARNRANAVERAREG